MRPAASGAFRRQPVTPHKTPTQTMNASAIEQAAHILWSNWRSQQRIAALPDDCRPAERAEGYEVQAALARLARVSLSGWKIAATSTAGQQHIGVDGPLAGRLLSNRVLQDGGSVPLEQNSMRVAEAEFAFRMAQTLVPRSAPYRVEEVMAAVGALHPAIEIPDSRYLDFTAVGAARGEWSQTGVSAECRPADAGHVGAASVADVRRRRARASERARDPWNTARS